VRKLDVSATLDEDAGRVSVYVVNRDVDDAREVQITIEPARLRSPVEVHTITGPDAGAVNTFEDRDRVKTHTETRDMGSGPTFTTTVPALSVTGFVFEIQ
jgi:alpha-N-arabinofuranosidase